MIKLFKVFVFVLLVIGSSNIGFGQSRIAQKQLSIETLPKEIKYLGNLKMAIGYQDSLGKSIFITTETGSEISKKFKHESDGSDAELFVYNFKLNNHGWVQTWMVYDFISDCPVDLEAKFIRNTPQITDLDSDGIAEVWMMYKTVCRGDVSPSTLKIIMYEGTQKYALRGKSKVFVGIDEKGRKHYEGGTYDYDKALFGGTKVFLNYALKLWDKNMLETFE